MLNRRQAIGAIAAPAILKAQNRRPNILFAFADDWGMPFASCFGDPVVKTPTFDRIAENGVVFTNAYVSAPSCTPSRAAILTGQWHWRLRSGANLGGDLPSEFAVYPDMLEGAGYHVGLTGKGWGPGNEQGGGRKRNPAGPRYPDFEAFLKARPQGTPFCYWFGSQDPHRGYTWESGVKSGMRLEDVRVPPYLPDSEVVRKDMCDYFWEVQRFNRQTQELLDVLAKTGELENTLVVMSGDNGWPFPRGKATIYAAGTHVPLAIQWGSRIRAGRKVEDFVSLPDLAPTFLEAAGVKVPADMTARTLMPILQSAKSGRVDAKRSSVLTGMERHVPCREAINGGYPMRALRNHDFHYIRNFLPNRWPAGDPDDLETATYEQLAGNTRIAFADVDAGPTKAWMVMHRSEAAVRPLYDLAFGKRPAQELYDLRKDPFQMKNVAGDPAYAASLKKLEAQLMAALKETKDPRATGGGEEFDHYATMTGASRGAAGAGQKKGKKK